MKSKDDFPTPSGALPVSDSWELVSTSYGKAGSYDAQFRVFETDTSFELPKNYTFPSEKKLPKFPVVAIDGDINDYVLWLHHHPEIDRRVPPIFNDFVITYSYAGVTMLANYEIFVHYTGDYTKFYFRVRMNGDKILYGLVDYERVNGPDFGVQGCVTDKAYDLYEVNWLQNTLFSAAFITLAVQAYMLYFKPEIVEKIYTPDAQSKEKKPSQTRRRITAEPIKLCKTKIKRIYLSAVDRPPKNVNYRKLSWHVRGHYRHVGKEKKLKYIQPFVCNRGGKKYHKNVRKYVLPDKNEP